MLLDPAMRHIVAYALIAIIAFAVIAGIVIHHRRKRHNKNYWRHYR